MEQLNLDGSTTAVLSEAERDVGTQKAQLSPVDETALGYWVRTPSAGPNTYKLMAGPRYAKIDTKLTALLGVSSDTIRRLAAAAFVEIRQPSPELYLLDLDSWQRHLDATDPAEDPDFWEPQGENRNKYLFFNNLGGHAPTE